jgi:hypothetical protein
VSPDAHSPAERADAVLRAAEAAAAAAQAAAAAAQAASLPPVAQEPPAAPSEPPAAPSEPSEPAVASQPPADVLAAHTVGAPERLLAAAGELGALVAQAREQLDALEDALARLEGPVESAQ